MANIGPMSINYKNTSVQRIFEKYMRSPEKQVKRSTYEITPQEAGRSVFHGVSMDSLKYS
jgi:hypothetical protein